MNGLHEETILLCEGRITSSSNKGYIHMNHSNVQIDLTYFHFFLIFKYQYITFDESLPYIFLPILKRDLT